MNSQPLLAQLNTALAGKQPLDSDLTALSGLATTAWGRQVLTLADSAAALTCLGAGTAATKDVPASGNASSSQVVKGDDTRLQAAADLTSHVALKNAHGVTRELITFTPQTPVHIPGNLLTHDQQTGQSGWTNVTPGQMTMTSVTDAGADGGGALRYTLGAGFNGYAYGSAIALGVTPDQSYTLSYRAKQVSGSAASKGVNADAYFRNAGGTPIAPTFNMGTKTIGVLGNGDVVCTVTVTAPAGAVTVVFNPYVHPSFGWLPGDVVDFSVLCGRTSPTIPESSGVADLTPDTGSGCWRVDANGHLMVTGSNGGSARAYKATVAPADASQLHVMTSAKLPGDPPSICRIVVAQSPWLEAFYTQPAAPSAGWASFDLSLFVPAVGSTTTAIYFEASPANGGFLTFMRPLLTWSTT
jgi:hypothetical protein